MRSTADIANNGFGLSYGVLGRPSPPTLLSPSPSAGGASSAVTGGASWFSGFNSSFESSYKTS